MTGTVTVRLDGTERRVSAGLKIRHLLGEEEIRLVGEGRLQVVDEGGHLRGLEGALADGLVLRLRPR
jgi:hypothetical protein